MPGETPVDYGTVTGLPAYRSHKVVQAARITAFEIHPNNSTSICLHIPGKEASRPCALVAADWMAKHEPQVGGYFVAYEDGYTSYSPAEAFESGYTLLEPVEYDPRSVIDENLRGCAEPDSAAVNEPLADDPWANRSAGMRCATCMWFVEKFAANTTGNVGRCRRHAPTMNGYPVVFAHDWCGDHKLNENAL